MACKNMPIKSNLVTNWRKIANYKLEQNYNESFCYRYKKISNRKKYILYCESIYLILLNNGNI